MRRNSRRRSSRPRVMLALRACRLNQERIFCRVLLVATYPRAGFSQSGDGPRPVLPATTSTVSPLCRGVSNDINLPFTLAPEMRWPKSV